MTPQITLRVDPARLNEWKKACEALNTNVSEELRRLMDAWSASVNGTREELPD